MTCEQRKDLIPLLPLGCLDPEEEAELRAHLSAGCPLCEGRLAEADALLSAIAFALPPAAPPAGAKERLMARVSAGRAAAPVQQRNAIAGRLGPALLGLAAGLIVAAGVGIRNSQSRHRSVARLQSQLSEKNNQIAHLRADVLMMQDVRQLVGSPSVQMVKLEGAAAQPGATACIFYDRVQQKVLFVGDKLRPPGANKIYELWLVSGDRKIPAGTFMPDANGAVAIVAVVTTPVDLGPIALAAVTDEPLGGVPQPTGQFQMLGKPVN